MIPLLTFIIPLWKKNICVESTEGALEQLCYKGDFRSSDFQIRGLQVKSWGLIRNGHVDSRDFYQYNLYISLITTSDN